MLYIPVLLNFVLNETVKFETSPYTLIGQMALLVILPYIVSQIVVHLLHQHWLVKNEILLKAFTLLLLFCIIVVSVGKVANQLVWCADYIWLAAIILAIYLIHGGLGYLIGWVWGNAE